MHNSTRRRTQKPRGHRLSFQSFALRWPMRNSAGSGDERRAPVVESEHGMREGVAFMHRLKLDLGSAVVQSGEIRSKSVTQTESEKITDDLGLMELPVQVKGGRNAVGKLAAPT